jgi:hypothetical protein
MSDSEDLPIPATAPLRGPEGSLLYTGSDGCQYIIRGEASGPDGDRSLLEAFEALRAGAPQLKTLIEAGREWIEHAMRRGVPRERAARLLIEQLTQALGSIQEPGDPPA